MRVQGRSTGAKLATGEMGTGIKTGAVTRTQDGKCRDRSRGRSGRETGLGQHKVPGGHGAGGTGWEWGAERGIRKHRAGLGKG